MEFLQYLSNPYAVIGLIVFVVAGAFGAKAKTTRRAGQNRAAPLLFAVALVGLVTTIAVAWIDMKKATATAETGPAGPSIKAEDGSNVVTGVEATDSSTVNINQGSGNQ